ncbi:unnamed protein product, partial [Ixodes hexagonus]
KSPTRTIYNYSVSQCVQLTRKNHKVQVGCFMCIYPGELDSQLEWPFRKVYTVGIVHPKNPSRVISGEVDAGDNGDMACFRKRQGKENQPCGIELSTTEKLERGGFIQENTLHMFLEIEP